MSKQRPEWNDKAAESILKEKSGMQGALLPVLNALQAKFGYINPAFVPQIATALNLSRAEVHGVISFYHDYREEPPGRRIIKICKAEACQAMGCRALEKHVQDSLGIKCGETDPSGNCTLEAVYCLGNCAASPAIMIDDRIHGRVTPEKFDALSGKKGKSA